MHPRDDLPGHSSRTQTGAAPAGWRDAGATLARACPERIERIAHHFDQGEDWAQALVYSQRAGDRAKAIYAGDEAISHYTRALKAWSLLREPGQGIKIELHHARGEVCQETGRFDQAEVDFQALYNLARAMGDKANQAHALNHTSYLQFQRGDFSSTREIAQQAQSLATTAGLESEVAASLFNQANALRNMGHYRQAIELYEQAATIFEKLDEQARLADCLNRMGYAWLFIGDYVQAQFSMARGLAIRRRLDERVGMAYSLVNLAGLYYYKGEFSTAWAVAEEALEVASSTGDPYGKDGALGCLGNAAMEQGRLDQAATFFQRAMEIAMEIGDQAVEMYVLSELGRVYHYLGALKQAERMLKQYFDLAPTGVEQHQHPIAHVYLAWLLLDMNRDEEALGQARAGLRIAQKIDSPWPLGLTHRAMGEVAACLCDKDPSLDPVFHFEESVRILRGIASRAELARSLAAYGLYLRRSAGTAQRNAALLDEARALFQQLGMARDLAQLAEEERAACSRPGQIQVRLPRAGAPTGRPLRADEYVEVVWTIAAPEDDEIVGKAARRRQRILRLLREADEQSAAPTVANLAEALEVNARTIKRDLAALRAVGHNAQTRGSHRAQQTR